MGRLRFSKKYAYIVGTRLLFLPLSLLIVVTLAFFLLQAMPGDPAQTLAGDFATKEAVEKIRVQLGLDQPLLVRYATYIANVSQGDLGVSFRSGQAVAGEIARYLPNTIELAVVGIVIAAVSGIAIGVVGAYYRNGWQDFIARVTISVIQAVPVFVLGLVLIFFMYTVFRVVPAPTGRISIGAPRQASITNFPLLDSLLGGQWLTFTSLLAHMILPAITLAILYSAFFAKITRGAMIAALNSDQVMFARASGLRERTVVRYALVEARTPIMTYTAILVAQVIGASTVIETVFAWRGVSHWGLQGILNVDLPVIQGFIIVIGIATTLTYLILDVLVMALDPRVSYSRTRNS